MQFSRERAKRVLQGVGLGFLVEARRAWITRRVASNAASGIDRASIARRHLHGAGLEIGALHAPLPVPDDVAVRFVDLFSHSANALRFPDLAADDIVEPHYIEDGFELSSIASNSQDFVIASHVLEHSPNPIQVLVNWSRVTRAGGALYVVVPIAEACFDAGRGITTLGHLIEDYVLHAQGDHEKLRERNRRHYQEWIAISEKKIFEDQGHAFEPASEEAIELRVKELLDSDTEIHFHTFSPESFRELLDHFCELRPDSRVLECSASEGEVVGVLRLGG